MGFCYGYWICGCMEMGTLRILRSRNQEGTYLLFMEPDGPLSMHMMRHLLMGQPACRIKRDNGANAAQRGDCGERKVVR